MHALIMQFAVMAEARSPSLLVERLVKCNKIGSLTDALHNLSLENYAKFEEAFEEIEPIYKKEVEKRKLKTIPSTSRQQFPISQSTNSLPRNQDQNATKLIVRKEGPNTGHGGYPNDADVYCSCSLKANRLTVKKEGPNKGRRFYNCCKIRDEQCGFFKWEDELDGIAVPSPASSGWQDPSNCGGGRGRDWGAAEQPGDSVPKKKQKCGICRQPGHNRKTCSNKLI